MIYISQGRGKAAASSSRLQQRPHRRQQSSTEGREQSGPAERRETEEKEDGESSGRSESCRPVNHSGSPASISFFISFQFVRSSECWLRIQKFVTLLNENNFCLLINVN
jgi:hypothetical protein